MLETILLVVRALALACRGHQQLVLEHMALRQQLRAFKRTTKRPRLRTRDRLFWIVLANAWRHWRTALVIVQPETVVRWHQDWLRHRWTRRSVRTHCGRPPVNREIRVLIREMATANPLGGAPRIHGELAKVGVDVSERTVSTVLHAGHRPPSQTWRTFLTNHQAVVVSMDFFTVPTVTGRVLFVLVVLAHHRRRIVYFNIAEHPTAHWTAQQVVEAFPDDPTPRWLLRDRDNIYGDAFRRRVAGMGITEVICSPASPWQNPYAERVIGSIRRECLDHVIVPGEAHSRRLLSAYVTYYNGHWPHRALSLAPPEARRSVASPSALDDVRIFRRDRLGGVVHEYVPAA